MALGLGFAELLGAVILLIAGITGSSIGSVVQGKPDHSKSNADEDLVSSGTDTSHRDGGTPGGNSPQVGRGPLGASGKVIGTPFAGTHAKAFNVSGGSDNWESENAVDIAVPVGTPVYAVVSGVIGSAIGALGSASSRMAGLRLHLSGAGNEYYYAHLSSLTVKAGDRVQAGDLLGYSGSANSVAHLHLASRDGNPLSILKGLGK